MKSKEDIKQQESMFDNQDLTSEVPVESKVVIEKPEEVNEESETIIEISASVSADSSIKRVENTNDEISIDDIRLKIDKKISELEANDHYITLCNIINSNNKLLKESKERIILVKEFILYANKYVKDLSDNFLKVLSATDWFDRYYDAVCLYDRAHDSNEALEWCEAMKDSLDTSISDIEKTSPKIRVLLNRRVANSVFTLSINTPYLRLKEDSFSEIMPFISNQSKIFYSWLKKIESLSLVLCNHLLELEFPYLKNETYSKSDGLNFEIVRELPISQRIETYIDSNTTGDNARSLYGSILKEIESFIANIADIESFHRNQYEENERIVKYLAEGLLSDYYKKELETIYRIYDDIQSFKDSIVAQYGESKERKDWCELLDSLSDTILRFLSKQNINPSPELTIGKSHINNSTFEINNKAIEFFSFAKIASATEAPNKELIEYVASIINYGFYHIDSNDNIKIIRETVVAVYN